MTQFRAYGTAGFYDEMFAADGQPRPGASLLVQRIASLPEGELRRRQRTAEQALLHLGITFNVYGDAAGTERIFPAGLGGLRLVPDEKTPGRLRAHVF